MRSVGVLLAAGLGQRFDSTRPGAKLLARFDEESVGERSLLNLSQAVDALIVVVRHSDTELAKRAQALGARVVVPAAHTTGMGHSIASGAALAATDYGDAQSLLLALADMPWVQPETHRSIVDRCDEHTIIRPRHAGVPGHPVAFGRAFWTALMQCEGDSGARGVLAHNAASVHFIEVSDSGVLRDIDQPGDLPPRLAP